MKARYPHITNLIETDNEFGGQDAKGPGGFSRWTFDDGDRTVYAFSPNSIMYWKVTVSSLAPESVFVAALDQAVEVARFGYDS